jgi:hypothetical protein
MAKRDKVSFDFQSGIILSALFTSPIKLQIAMIAARLFGAYPMRLWGKFVFYGWNNVNQG